MHGSSILSTHSGHHRLFIGPVFQKRVSPGARRGGLSFFHTADGDHDDTLRQPSLSTHPGRTNGSGQDDESRHADDLNHGGAQGGTFHHLRKNDDADHHSSVPGGATGSAPAAATTEKQPPLFTPHRSSKSKRKKRQGYAPSVSSLSTTHTTETVTTRPWWDQSPFSRSRVSIGAKSNTSSCHQSSPQPPSHPQPQTRADGSSSALPSAVNTSHLHPLYHPSGKQAHPHPSYHHEHTSLTYTISEDDEPDDTEEEDRDEDDEVEHDDLSDIERQYDDHDNEDVHGEEGGGIMLTPIPNRRSDPFAPLRPTTASVATTDVTAESTTTTGNLSKHGTLTAKQQLEQAANPIKESDRRAEEKRQTLKSRKERVKRDKTIRDEDEPNRFQKMLGAKYRDKRKVRGHLLADDIGQDWTKGPRPQMTSGALVAGQHGHRHEGSGSNGDGTHSTHHHHTVLVSSPLSSEVDLPSTNHPDALVRPALATIQPVGCTTPPPGGMAGPDQEARSNDDTGLAAPSPFAYSRGSDRDDGRRPTWVTAVSSFGGSSQRAFPIYEDDESISDQDEVDEEDEDEESDEEGAQQDGNQPLSDGQAQVPPHECSEEEEEVEPDTSILGRANTLLRSLSLKNPNTSTSTKSRQHDASGGEWDESEQPYCDAPEQHRMKKHVRFLTKVQISSLSRQPTAVGEVRRPPSRNPILKQDRMLVRKEVTERPGPHVFNATTARRFDRQSQGWKEWWCVLKGPPPTSTQPKARLKILKKRKKERDSAVEKGRLEFYYNHKKIMGTILLTSHTTVSIYSSLDYTIALTQNYKDEIGLTIYILRPRTVALACAWYLELYSLLHGEPPIPNFIEINIPDFDVKVRVPIPEDSETETDMDSEDEQRSEDTTGKGVGWSDGSTTTVTVTSRELEGGPSNDSSNRNHPDPRMSRIDSPDNTLSKGGAEDRAEGRSNRKIAMHGAGDTATGALNDGHQSGKAASAVPDSDLLDSFHTALERLPSRMASKSFYMSSGVDAKPTLVTPQEVTPALLRSHVLHLLKDVPDWTEVVKTWLDPSQHGDVALCWKRYDRIEWVYFNNPVLGETDNLHLKQGHIGYACGSDWSGDMDTTVVGPQVLDKTHILELRPVTHYPTKVKEKSGIELEEPDPIEGFLIRVSSFTGKQLRRYRRLYLSSHDHLLMYTIPSQSHCPTMQHVGESIDPSILMFCITPHRSANPDHKDISQSRSVRRLKAQVRAARGFIDLTKVKSATVLTVREWHIMRGVPVDEDTAKNASSSPAAPAAATGHARSHTISGTNELAESPGAMPDGDGQEIVMGEANNYFFPEVPVAAADAQPAQHKAQEGVQSAPMRTTILRKTTMAIDRIIHPDDAVMQEQQEDEYCNVFAIEMEGGVSVRFRAFNAEAAKLWCEQIEKLAHYWRARKHQDVKMHMQVSHANYQLASTLDDDEVQVGEVIQDWDNDRAMVEPRIWNWCIPNGCRSITKSGMIYYKPKWNRTFRKIFVVLTEGCMMLFHPHRRSHGSGQLIPTTNCKLLGIHSLQDVYIYSGYFSGEDTSHGTNDESERLPRFFPDGLIADDPDEDCTFSIWRPKRRMFFSRKRTQAREALGMRGTTANSMPSTGSSSAAGTASAGWLGGRIKEGVVYGSKAKSCEVFRARSRPDLEEWVYAIQVEIEKCVRQERKMFRAAAGLRNK
ncbi:hypothetical protein BGZ73_003967 [Actinomortierella ambigua]|nr:hypothetical protein BGZ73_003967 [Actinomortierella ambigua]